MTKETESTIAMTLVPDEQRLDFWFNHFGNVKGWGSFAMTIRGDIGSTPLYRTVVHSFTPILMRMC